MKIGLVIPPSGLVRSVHGKYLSLGVAYVAASIRQAGHEVKLIDANILNDKEVEKEILKFDFEVLGISVPLSGFSFTEKIVSLVKEKEPLMPVIIGGSLVSSSPETIVQNIPVDVAVIGEGEKTIVELLSNLKNTGKVKGICYPGKNRKAVFTLPQSRIANLDRIPFPAFDLFDLATYFFKKPKYQYLADISPYLSLMTHRGCVHNCLFCQIPKIWPTISLRSIENVIKELEWQKEKFDIKGVYFRDDNFCPSERRIIDLCEQLKNSTIDIGFVCLMRATSVAKLQDKTLKLMSQAGCRGIRIGIESGDEKILQAIHKEVTKKDIRTAIKKIKDHGISPDGSFIMIGHPDETKQSLENTLEFVSEMKIRVRADYAIPLPGTAWYEIAKARGLIKNEVAFLRALKDWDARPIVNMTKMRDANLIEAFELLND